MSQAPAYLTAEITAPSDATAFTVDFGGIVAYGADAPSPVAFTLAAWNGTGEAISALSVVTYDSHAASLTTAAEVDVTYALTGVNVAAASGGTPGPQIFAPVGFSSGALPSLKVTGTLAAATTGSIRIGIMLHDTLPVQYGAQNSTPAKSVTVGTSAVRLDTGLANRRFIIIVNNGSSVIYVDASTSASSVTTSSGLPLAASGGAMTLDVGPDLEVYAISGTAGQNVRVAEFA